jgi:hypothetical protein
VAPLADVSSPSGQAKDGEMSEWLKEHAWKLLPATLTR